MSFDKFIATAIDRLFTRRWRPLAKFFDIAQKIMVAMKNAKQKLCLISCLQKGIALRDAYKKLTAARS